jgi:hypothetical protein
MHVGNVARILASLPRLQLVRVEPFCLFAYLLSLGFKRFSLLPERLYPVSRLERDLAAVAGRGGSARADRAGKIRVDFLYSGSAAQAASGTLRFVSQSGQPLSLLIW